MKQILFFFLLQILFLFTSENLFAQAFTTAEYRKAHWMTTRMYGGQRSGENNWLLYDHLPAGVSSSLRGKCFISDQDTDGYDLSGGWHDAGDHVKFGQTQYYSAYMLLKGYAEFPTGYDDYYSYDYQGYKASGDWTWEGNQHDPNGIPDVLDEVKHATDYFIKCTRNSSTFYYQVGDGDPDHTYWMTAVKMQTMPAAQGGQPRSVYKNPADASMPSFCGAALALMSRVYRKFDPAYADLCLQHALYAYDYAKANPGTAQDANGGDFYSANSNWKDDYATMCAELYWATNNEAYKTEALAFSISASPGSADIYGNSYGFDYENNGDIAIYNLALLGKTGAQGVLNSIVTNYYLGNVQADGQFAGGNTSWGPLRYNVNTAFIVALWQKLHDTDETPHAYIYDNLDYILGDNSANQSFIVGFGANSPQQPHHRNIYLQDGGTMIPMTIPAKNAQAGLMIGGTRDASTFNDNMITYQHTEGGIDYNACLVGVLAYILSDMAPVDTSRFGHPIPNLGPDQSLCGVTQIVLDAQIAPDTKKTFTWKKDGVTVSGPSTTASTFTATEAGVYTCIVDSMGKWSTQAEIELSDELPDFDLGADKDLCDPATVTLKIEADGTGITYLWTKDGSVIPGATGKTYTVYNSGLYRGTISAGSCASKYDEVLITSQHPTVNHDTICNPGQVDLSITGTGGPYEWYDAETGGNLLHTGTTYTPTITATTTYYVKDGSSISVTAGPSASSHTLTGATNSGSISIKFSAAQAFTITELKILPFIYYCGPSTNVSVEFELQQGSTVLGTYSSTPVPCTGEQDAAPYDDYYTLSFPTPISVPGPGTYDLFPSDGNQLVWFNDGADLSAMDVAGVIDILGDSRTDKPNSFPGIFDLKIQAGFACGRTPVLAVVDANACPLSVQDPFAFSTNIYPNPSTGSFNLTSEKKVSVKVYDGAGRLMDNMNETEQAVFGKEYLPGIYHVIIEKDKKIKTFNIVKD